VDLLFSPFIFAHDKTSYILFWISGP